MGFMKIQNQLEAQKKVLLSDLKELTPADITYLIDKYGDRAFIALLEGEDEFEGCISEDAVSDDYE